MQKITPAILYGESDTLRSPSRAAKAASSIPSAPMGRGQPVSITWVKDVKGAFGAVEGVPSTNSAAQEFGPLTGAKDQ